MSEYPAVVIIAPSAERGEGAAPPPTRSCPSLKCRNFWRAGSVYDAPLDAPPLPEEQVTPSDFAHARVHPKFLHTNATSHKWAFGAIAELLDNAVDEICNGATFVKVDKVNNQKDNSPIFLVQDDGAGMDPEGIRGCMSLGFSTKKSKTTIGQYGNGFKTSTMRLGADAIVFSRAVRGGRATQSIGLLSYTYLRRTMKDDIVVPMIDFQILGDQVVPLPYSSQDDWNDSLKVILDWSPFFSREDLLLQFKDVGSHGTKVLIYNLWMDDDGLLELDFDDDDEDILLRNQVNNGGASGTPKEIVQSHISNTHKYSLRAYASILYLRKFTNFQIILRRKPVEHYNIKDELKFTKTITYKPQVGIAAEVVSVKTTIGFAKEAPVLGIFGINVYHKNRLIMPFWKVVQEGSSRGRCVIGVLEANFMEPAHDKQDFERTALFIRLESKLKQFVYEYWRDHCHLIGYQSSSMRNKPKVSDKCSHDVTPKGQKKMHATRHVTGISAGVGEPIIELADDFHHMQSTEHIVGLPAVNGSTGLASAPIPNFEIETSEPREVENFEDFEGIQSMDFAEPNLIEKVVEENIQLFGRRDELQRRETELKHMIEELQSELEKTKRKCARAASELEIRKQHLSAG